MVDNGPSDGTVSFIESVYPSVKIIKNSENRGACFARNQGIEAARGNFIMLMDCDAYLDNNFFINLKEILKALPANTGALSTKIINVSSKKIFSCGLKISPIYRVFDAGRGKPSNSFISPFAVDGPNSCCAVYRKDVLEKIKEENYFDNDFFFLFEDADLALRLKRKNYRCLFVPELVCYHYGSGSGLSGGYRRFLCFRNRWFMILKYNKGMKLLIFLLRSFLYDFIRTIHFAFTNRRILKLFRDVHNKMIKRL